MLAERFPSIAKMLAKVAHSPVEPSKIPSDLAAMWAQTQLKGHVPNALYIVSGWGSHVHALLARLDASSCVVVYEASLPMLAASLASEDYRSVLADSRVHLFAGEVPSIEFERLHFMPVARVGVVVPLRFSLAWQQAPEAYAGFFANFAVQFDVVRRLHLTNFHDSLFWQATVLANLGLHCRAPDVQALKGVFSQLPVVLVGAGPSLDEATEFLKSVQDRAMIVAVNSSYRKLRRTGVVPHLVLAADPRADTARGFADQPTEGTFLVAPFIVNPQVVERFQGKAFAWSGENNYFISLLRQRVGLGPGTTIAELGTVSISVADLAFYMGSRQLILVGQDMAISADGQTHTSDSIYEGTKLTAEQLKSQKDSAAGMTRWVTGNTQDRVPALNNLFIYLKAFEQWVAAHPKMEVWNTARLGAKVAGVDYITYLEALRRLPSAHRQDIRALIQTAFDTAPERRLTQDAWTQALLPTLRYAQKLYERALRGALALEALPQRYWQPSYRESSEVKEIYSIANSVNELLEKSPEDYRVIIEGRLKKTLLDFQIKLTTLEAENPFAQELSKNKEFFWALVEGTEPLVGLLTQKMEASDTKDTERVEV